MNVGDADKAHVAPSTGAQEQDTGATDGQVTGPDDVVTRLAAQSVIATNRRLGQRSLREFLS